MATAAKERRKHRKARPAKYSREFMATALVLLEAHDGNIRQTARELRIPESTLRKWLDDPDLVGVEERARKTIDLIDATERLIDDLAGGMRRLMRQGKGNMRDAAIAFGVAVDKLEILRRLPQVPGGGEAVTHQGIDWNRLTPADLRTVLDILCKADGSEGPEPIPVAPPPVVVEGVHDAQ